MRAIAAAISARASADRPRASSTPTFTAAALACVGASASTASTVSSARSSSPRRSITAASSVRPSTLSGCAPRISAAASAAISTSFAKSASVAEAQIGVDVARPFRRRALQRLERLRVALGALVDQPDLVERLGVLRLDPEHVAQLDHRLGVVAGLDVLDGALEMPRRLILRRAARHQRGDGQRRHQTPYHTGAPEPDARNLEHTAVSPSTMPIGSGYHGRRRRQQRRAPPRPAARTVPSGRSAPIRPARERRPARACAPRGRRPLTARGARCDGISSPHRHCAHEKRHGRRRHPRRGAVRISARPVPPFPAVSCRAPRPPVAASAGCPATRAAASPVRRR